MADTTSAPLINIGRGIALILFANLLFAFVDTSTKWLLGAGLVVTQLAFMRYAVHFAITATERGIRGARLEPLPTHTRNLVLLRSFCLVSATLANFLAIGNLPLAVTAALLYLSPIFIFAFAALLLGERITRHNYVAVLLGFAGALLILQPFGQPINWYAVLMLYPAAAMALYQVLSRRLAGEVRTSILQFYTGALGTAALAPFALFTWTMPETAQTWTLLIGIGAFAWFGHEALTRAHAHAEASTLAPFGYSFVIFLSALGWLIFGEAPAPNVAAGAALILVAGLYTWRTSR
ncbi:MAG: DMT family transporter [Pseudomonadota bacterium]